MSRDAPLIAASGAIRRAVLYAEAIYGDAEKQAVLRSMENKWLASGPLVREFEGSVARQFGKRFGVAVNSGSSANLLALKLLNLPAGSEVITPACTFSTTVSAIALCNLHPVFVDTVHGRYTVGEDPVEDAISERTRAILVPQLVGGVCDLVRLRRIADRHGLFLIDDSCDTIAPAINGSPIAQLAEVSTTSFYGSHIITALGQGGMLLTDRPEIRRSAVMLRDWGSVAEDSETFGERFDLTVDGMPYDAKYTFADLGFNLKLNEAAAAFGLVQLTRLAGFVETRRRNYETLWQAFGRWEELFVLPELLFGAETTWLAFPLTVRPSAPFSRTELLACLEAAGIQTRVLFSGNITRHAVCTRMTYRQVGQLRVADEIMAGGFLLGLHPGVTPDQIAYMIELVGRFLGEHR